MLFIKPHIIIFRRRWKFCVIDRLGLPQVRSDGGEPHVLVTVGEVGHGDRLHQFAFEIILHGRGCEFSTE